MRAPMALGGGSRTKGMPAPRVSASQMIRIQAPKMAGMSSRSSESLGARAGFSLRKLGDAAPGQQPAGGHQAEEGVRREPLVAGDVRSSRIQAAQCAPTNRAAAT